MYGYKIGKDRFEAMCVLWASCEPLPAAFLEASLIQLFQGQTGLKNERPGGETVPKDRGDDMDGPYCVYFVFRSFQRPPDRKTPMA
ncbi:unnamed protein product [Cladocopium goreaui]|uniref:Uncharacterized protein n=1 Tax=Cladocopium goreaui TaxID=2562237 RepID=A0A9P1BSH6_9DINO|nr:unnamed protein product [Cladocopium goreaui]